MNPINQTATAGYTQVRTASAPTTARAATPETGQAAPVSAGSVVATQHTQVTRVGPDLTAVTPKEVMGLAASLFEEGTIDIHQMVGLYAISSQQQYPPMPGGSDFEASPDNDPFNLLQKVEEHSALRPEQGQDRPLLEILIGLQNAMEVEQQQSIDLRA